jgi:outer membrane protein assembly factor BamE (lipoprotein component of BamABCDE complex)
MHYSWDDALTSVAVAAALLLAGCSKVTQDNFAKVQEGMSEQQVIAVLGSPSESARTPSSP